MTLDEIHDAVKEALEATGWRVLPDLRDTVPAPCIILDSGEFDPRFVFQQATSVYPFHARAWVKRVAERASLAKLNKLRSMTGTESLVQSVQNDDNWAEGIDYMAVTLVGRRGESNWADDVYLVCDFDIEVCASNG